MPNDIYNMPDRLSLDRLMFCFSRPAMFSISSNSLYSMVLSFCCRLVVLMVISELKFSFCLTRNSLFLVGESFSAERNANLFSVVPFATLPVGAIFGAMGLGFCLSLLFFMDQNISAALVNAPQNK